MAFAAMLVGSATAFNAGAPFRTPMRRYDMPRIVVSSYRMVTLERCPGPQCWMRRAARLCVASLTLYLVRQRPDTKGAPPLYLTPLPNGSFPWHSVELARLATRTAIARAP